MPFLRFVARSYGSTLKEPHLTIAFRVDFQMNAQELLKETQRAAGGEKMVMAHEKLMNLNKEVKEIQMVRFRRWGGKAVSNTLTKSLSLPQRLTANGDSGKRNRARRKQEPRN